MSPRHYKPFVGVRRRSSIMGTNGSIITEMTIGVDSISLQRCTQVLKHAITKWRVVRGPSRTDRLAKIYGTAVTSLLTLCGFSAVNKASMRGITILVLGRSLPARRTVTPVRASGSKCQSWLVELLGRMPRSGHRTEAREDAASAAQGRPRAFPLFYLESAHQVPIWCGASTGHGSRGLSNRRASGPEHKSYYNDAFGTGYGGWNTTSKLLITAE